MKNIFLGILSLSVIACTPNYAGRNQIAFMSDSEINKMGAQAFNTLKQKTKESNNKRYNRFAKCISQAIVPFVGGNWEIVVFEDKSLNAFALPGNKIGIHTGLIKLVANQHQLAAVIGHEIGHVIAKHSNERVSQEMLLKGGIGLIGAVAQPASALGQLGMNALGLGAQFGVLLPYSRTHETEADVIGLDLMAKAGFDPRQSVKLWQKMSQASKNSAQPPEFMSTHPAHTTRINGLNKNMSRAMQTYQNAKSLDKTPRCKK